MRLKKLYRSLYETETVNKCPISALAYKTPKDRIFKAPMAVPYKKRLAIVPVNFVYTNISSIEVKIFRPKAYPCIQKKSSKPVFRL